MLSAGEARGQLCETAPEMSLDTWSQYANEVLYPNVPTACYTFQHAAYLRFTAPQSGQYQFSAQGQCDSNRQTVFAVLGGCPSTEPACLSGVYSSACNEVLLAPISLAAGQQVVLVVGSFNGAYPTSGQARVRYLPPVQPPECSAAPEMSLDTWSQYANEVLYPNVPTACYTFQHAAYLRFTAPQAGQYQFSAQGQCDSNRQTVFAVLGGCPSTEPACLSGVYSSACNEVLLAPISLAAGQQVVLVVGSFNGAYPTSGQARVRYLPPVQPPECSAAPEMSLDTWSQYANEVLYPNVPTACYTFQHAAYLRFTAPQSGQYQFSAQGQCDSNRQTVFAVLGGCPSTEPACLSGVYSSACNEVLLAPISLAAGQQVVLVVGSFNGAYPTSGQARVRYLPPVQPPECSAAPEMSLDTWSQYANEVLYPNVPTACYTFQHAAYLRFTAPQSGQYQFSAQGQCDSNRQTVFAVLGGCPSTEPACLSGVYSSACNEVLLAPISLAAGQQVVLVVGSFNGAYPTSGQARVRYLPPVQPPECSAAPEMSLDTWSQYANEVLYPNVPTACYTFQHAAYLRFTAPQAGQYQFSAQGQCDSNRQTVFAVLGGCPSTEPACLSGVYSSACNEVLLAPISLAAGQQVVLVVGSFNGAYPTSGQARVRYLPECTNDFDGDGVNDCVDGCPLNPNLTAPINYYADADGDGFGAGAPTASCTAISNRVTNNLDCDDSRLLYADDDGDGYGAGSSIACGSASNADCDDSKSNVHPGQLEACNGLDDNCDGVVDEGACGSPAVQWRAEHGGNGHWYQFVRADSYLCWGDARTAAESAGGMLVSVTSEGESGFVESLVAGYPGTGELGPYIGATCEGRSWGAWYWITGEPFVFTNWNWGEPNGYGSEQYVQMYSWSSGLRWNDTANCNLGTRSYVVEWSSDCNGDGIIDYGQVLAGGLADDNHNNVPDSCESQEFVTTVGFDDVPTTYCALNGPISPNTGSIGEYAGFRWLATSWGGNSCSPAGTVSVYSTEGTTLSGYLFAATSGGQAAFTSGQSSVLVSRSERWNFKGSYFTAAWSTGLRLRLVGLRGNQVAFDTTTTLGDPTGPTWVGADYDCIDSLLIETSGGTPFGYPNQTTNVRNVIFDDFTYSLGGMFDLDGDGVDACNDACPLNPELTAPATYYADIDGDGFGGTILTTSVCETSAPAGFIADGSDCNDTVGWIHPGADEILCNGVDENCDGVSGGEGCGNNDECAGATEAVVGANTFSTFEATMSTEPVSEAKCGGSFLDWGTNNKDIWMRFVAPSDGKATFTTCDPWSFDTSMVLYAGDCGSLVQTACNGDGPFSADCQYFHSMVAEYPMVRGEAVFIRIGGWAGGGIPSYGIGTLTITFECTPQPYYHDLDADGFGFGEATMSCDPIVGFVDNNLDCNDDLKTYLDSDGDGFGADAPVACGVASNSDCDDAFVMYADNDGDGYGAGAMIACGGVNSIDDCNDNDASVYPGAAEVCANLGTDNDCDGINSDDEAIDSIDYFVDGDQDGFGAGAPRKSCSPIPGSVPNADDCDDTQLTFADADADGFGSGPWIACGTATNDTDCDDARLLYADADGDGYGAGGPIACGVTSNSDCNDSDSSIHPSAIEYCNDTDDDCDGTVDGGACSLPATQWSRSNGGNGHWYRSIVVPGGVTWDSARRLAEAVGGRLACAETSAERAHLFTAFTPQAEPASYVQWPGGESFGPWLGGYQLPGSVEPIGGWRWLSGPCFDPTEVACCNDNCAGGSEDRLELYYTPQGVVTWNDLPNDSTPCGGLPVAYVIEWSFDCNNDGIVDYGQILAGEIADANGNNIPDCCEGGGNCPGAPVQWRVEDGGNGHWYRRIDRALAWQAAKLDSEALGGHLVTVTSSAEWQFLKSALPVAECWAGASQAPSNAGYSEPAGGWAWVTGEPFVVEPYVSLDDCPAGPPAGCNCGSGAQDALFFTGCCANVLDDIQDGSPGDCIYYPGDEPDGFIIEYDADCNNDGLVDFGQILDGTLVDANHNHIPDDCECTGDLDHDGFVGSSDLSLLLTSWGGVTPSIADINGDGEVNAADMSLLLSHWGICTH